MAAKTQIEWTDATWNPVTGCTKISPGCKNCYAERFSERFRGVANHPFEFGFDIQIREKRLAEPLKWQRPLHIFVNSMSDLFHKQVPVSFIDKVFDTMERADWHTFQILTKRSSRMRTYIIRRYHYGRVPNHIWLGVSVEDSRRKSRIDHLREVNANTFISFEPLIGPIGYVDLTCIDWVIVGGESGPRARRMEASWATEIRQQCEVTRVPFFFKQWGGLRPKSGGRILEGREWNSIPSRLRLEAESHGGAQDSNLDTRSAY